MSSTKDQPNGFFGTGKISLGFLKQSENEKRIAYLMDNFPTIQKHVEQWVKDTGAMPAYIYLCAQKEKIVIGEDLQELLNLNRVCVPLNEEIKARDYGQNDCVLLVETPTGTMRTSYRQAELRYMLKDSDTVQVSSCDLPFLE